MPLIPMDNRDLITIKCDGSTTTIHKFGATIISWIVAGNEKLFVRRAGMKQSLSEAEYPLSFVIFKECSFLITDIAQFGTGPILPGQHGFARNQVWKLEKTKSDTLTCTLEENEKTLKLWPFKFKLTYTIVITKDELKTSLRVDNPSEVDKPFEFTCLLHTYFMIQDITSVKITDLSGLQYRDKLKDGAEFLESRSVAGVDSEIDRIYLDTPHQVELRSANGTIELHKSNFSEFVLWNPWIEKSKSMADFDDEEYKQMLCIEAGTVTKPIGLQPGCSWNAEQTLRCIFP